MTLLFGTLAVTVNRSKLEIKPNTPRTPGLTKGFYEVGIAILLALNPRRKPIGVSQTTWDKGLSIRVCGGHIVIDHIDELTARCRQ
jgi:hypothetical protein